MTQLMERSSPNIKIHTDIRRHEIYLADLRGGNGGSEQTGLRPLVIISNNKGNKFSPTMIAVSVTTASTKAKLPTHVLLEKDKTGLRWDSVALCEQIKTVDEYRIIEKVGTLDEETSRKLDKALAISVGLDYLYYN